MPSHWNDERLRGRAGVAQRKRRLALFPLCAECTKVGIVRATDQIDHIKPLGQGGTDTDDNCQGLCLEHHNRKTASEDVAHGGAALHPDWLQPSAIPLTIVSGPPCSGKTTHIERHAEAGDIVIDLDGIKRRLKPGFKHWTGALDSDLFLRAVRTRNAMLGSLSRQSAGRAWFIVSAPTQAERDWWQTQLGGDVLLLHPGVDECKRRAIKRGTPLAIKGVDQWERESRRSWEPKRPKSKPTIGLDGWPT